MEKKPTWYLLPLFLTACLWWAGCDSVQPGDEGTLVIEAYLDVGKPLPVIRVSRVTPLSTRSSSENVAVAEAAVTLTLDGAVYVYEVSSESQGLYKPTDALGVVVPFGKPYSLSVEVGEKQASASGITPFSVSIQQIRTKISPNPVEAVLLDSLDLGLDSLNISLNTRKGYIYPVEVSIDWLADEDAPEPLWIETKLKPFTDFSSSIIDFFLLPSDIFPEDSKKVDDGRLRTWNGVYAVPVALATDVFPAHELQVALLRSNDSYAQHASSRLDPTGREPLTNLTGAVGFVGAMSIDSLRIEMKNNLP